MFIFGWFVYIIMIQRILIKICLYPYLLPLDSLLLQQVINLIFGPEVQTIDMEMPVYDAFDNMVTVPLSKIITLGLAAIIAIGVVIFMKRSRVGQAIRAAQDPVPRASLGSISTVYMLSHLPLMRRFAVRLGCWSRLSGSSSLSMGSPILFDPLPL